MPEFEPLRPARGARLRRAVARRRRLLAALLAMAAAALAASPRGDAERPSPAAVPDGPGSGVPGGAAGAGAEGRGGGDAGAGEVLAPVRIADAGVVGLLKPGDLVDVLATGGEDGGTARVVARAARVAEIPGAAEAPDAERGADATGAAETEGTAGAPGSAETPGEASAPGAADGQWPSGAPELAGWDDGTLVVLSVPGPVAAALAGAAAGEGLAVTLR